VDFKTVSCLCSGSCCIMLSRNIEIEGRFLSPEDESSINANYSIFSSPLLVHVLYLKVVYSGMQSRSK